MAYKKWQTKKRKQNKIRNVSYSKKHQKVKSDTEERKVKIKINYILMSKLSQGQKSVSEIPRIKESQHLLIP